LCETEEQIKFYTSLKFCIAVPSAEARLNVEEDTPSGIASVTTSAEPANHNSNGNSRADRSAPNVCRRPHSSEHAKERQLCDMPPPVRHAQKAEDPDIPACLRKQKN
jgi:hypothetical protein